MNEAPKSREEDLELKWLEKVHWCLELIELYPSVEPALPALGKTLDQARAAIHVVLDRLEQQCEDPDSTKFSRRCGSGSMFKLRSILKDTRARYPKLQ